MMVYTAFLNTVVCVVIKLFTNYVTSLGKEGFGKSDGGGRCRDQRDVIFYFISEKILNKMLVLLFVKSVDKVIAQCTCMCTKSEECCAVCTACCNVILMLFRF